MYYVLLYGMRFWPITVGIIASIILSMALPPGSFETALILIVLGGSILFDLLVVRPTRQPLERVPQQQVYQAYQDPNQSPANPTPQVKPAKKAKKQLLRSVDEIWQDINDMIGLTSVKQALMDIGTTLDANQIKKDQGMEVTQGTLHMVFKGNPGTGKTEVARKIGELFCAMGVLSGQAFVTCTVGDLIGEYVGATRPKTRAKIEEVLNEGGGVLFIDEAYGLYSSSQNSFTPEAVEELIQWMENERDKLCVVLAGYSNEMDTLLKKANPGLKSRVAFTLDFPDYSPDELIEILKLQAGRKKYKITPDAIKKIRNHLPSVDMKTEGNGRYVRNLLEKAERKQSYRVLQGEDPSLLIADDFDFGYSTERQLRSVDDIWQDIDGMIGLTSVKQALIDIGTTLEANQIKKNQGMEVTQGTLHMVFKGNPGTGKTEVARKIGELFCAMGVLSGQAFVTCTVGDLIGEYVGATRPKTRAKIEEVLNEGGGVLFIDEAYGLYSSSPNSFTPEAVEELIQWMENERDKLCVVLAGYSDEMDTLLKKANPGLKSRVAFTLDFPDYSPDELIEILKLQAGKKKYKITPDAVLKIRNHLPSVDMKIEGNGRYVRNLLEKAERKQSYRVLQGDDPSLLVADDFDFGEKPSKPVVKAKVNPKLKKILNE